MPISLFRHYYDALFTVIMREIVCFTCCRYCRLFYAAIIAAIAMLIVCRHADAITLPPLPYIGCCYIAFACAYSAAAIILPLPLITPCR